MLEDLAAFEIIQALPPAQVNLLAEVLRPVSFQPGEIIARETEPGSEIIFVVQGRVEASRHDDVSAEFGPGQVIGVIPVVSDIPHVATGIVQEAVKGYALSKPDFDRLREDIPEFDLALRGLTSERLEMLDQLVAERDQRARDWLQAANRALQTGTAIPDEMTLRKVADEYHGAPMAIWLGILLDGVPESFVIGAGLLVALQSILDTSSTVQFGQVVPYTLIAGLFLSNFPEALASSANMRLQGMGKRRVLLLWTSLLAITALGAGAGYLLADTLDHVWVVFAEGVAAGAMLTMIAAAMLPEAVHMGRATEVGLSTLVGFLAAISFSLFG